MKKVLFILSIFIICMCFYKVNATTNSYAEKVYTIEFDNLSSKRINELFINMNINIISIEVSTSRFTKEYRFNLYMTNNLERDLNKLVINDLKNVLTKEEVSILEVSGFNIKSITLRCNKIERDLILERSIYE